ncbi:hypothetical protein D3C73_557820 [compost metagenome]
MTWIEISMVCGTLAFIVGIWTMVRTLLLVHASIEQVNLTLVQARQSMQAIAEPSEQLLLSSKKMVDELQDKVQGLSGLFDSMDQAGHAVGEVAGTMRQASVKLTETINQAQRAVQTHQKRVRDSMEWAVAGMELWNRWQASRRSKTNSISPEET